MIEGEVKATLLWLSMCSLAAQERWTEVRAGPFQVMSAAGQREALEALGEVEQFRYLLGRILSRDELRSSWPIRILVFPNGRGIPEATPPAMGRDSFVGSLVAGVHPPPAWLRTCARIFLEANTRRLPPEIEEGLLDYYATVRIDRLRVTVGQPPPQPNLNWARIHLLSHHPDYSGKLRPLLYNLEQGMDAEPAWKNAVGKSPQQIEKEAAAYLAAGKFANETISGRPLNPRMDFRPEPVEPPRGEIALADFELARGRFAEARAIYQKLASAYALAPEPHEGLALVALAGGQTQLARLYLREATERGSRNARIWLEAARLEADDARALALLRKAVELAPEWAEPRRALAERDKDPARRLAALASATKLAPRDASLWQALAEAQEQANDFRAAARSWAAAEQNAANEEQRRQLRQLRLGLEQRRLEAEAAARRREAEERERELARVKEEALARIRAAEARANREAGAPPARVEQWFDTPRPSGKVSGRLQQVDCLRGAARLVLRTSEGKLLRLAIRDPSKVVVVGGGKLELPCGVQKQAPQVVIEYFPQDDAKLGTSGEVATIEYR